jgi:hypothetical protein
MVAALGSVSGDIYTELVKWFSSCILISRGRGWKRGKEGYEL